MSWTAIVPLKAGRDRKSRLASVLSEAERAALSDRMAAHVLDVLTGTQSVSRVVWLSPMPPPGGRFEWREDRGRGLNVELTDYCAERDASRVVIIHADLPLLTAEDVDVLVSAADAHGAAIAPDRHRQGTNALALARPTSFEFAFGSDSFGAHRGLIKPEPAIVSRVGLSHDVDTPDDLRAVAEQGVNLIACKGPSG